MRTPEEQAAYIDHLESEIEKVKAEKQKLEVEIGRLKKERGLTREDLTFNQRTGLWSDQSGQLYCPKCLGDEKRNPLKVEQRGWRCTVCTHWFENPDSPPPVVRTRGPGGRGGPNSWMGN